MPSPPLKRASPLPRASPERAAAVRVLLVDDHRLTRQGMKSLLQQDPRFEICGEADNTPQALDLARQLNPDLAIVDISLPSTDGIELTKGLRALIPNLQVLVVSMHDEEVYAERALRAGALGYLSKQEASDELINAVECILGGDVYVSARVKNRMLQRMAQTRGAAGQLPVDALSDREIEVLQHIGNGFGTREIAVQLGLSVKTIDSYREHLKQKLNLATGSELIRYAIQWMRSQVP